MKKITLITTIIFTANLLFGQLYNKIDTSFYSEILDKDVLVDIYFPPGYDENPNLYYPVIYYLHGWYGDQNSVSTFYSWTQALINYGTIDPVILVGANNNVEPFFGSCYTNSIIWGNYEDMMVEELPEWIENSFRAIPDRNARALSGASMGAYGSFMLGLKHPNKYCAFAAHAAEINFELFMNEVHMEVMNENNGPPYNYDFDTGGFFTQWMFISGAAFTPNYNTPQTYVTPSIVEFPYDENGQFIDTVTEKWKNFDVLPLLHNFPPNESIGIFYSCGENDDLHIYPANLALADTLDNLGLPYIFYSHDGGHNMPGAFKEKALLFIDSLMMGPLTAIDEITNAKSLSFSIIPNPVIESTQVQFTLHKNTKLCLNIFNITGKMVLSKEPELKLKGEHQIPLSLASLPEGIYFCRLQIGNEVVIKKIIKL